jgi:hypothetical protein
VAAAATYGAVTYKDQYVIVLCITVGPNLRLLRIIYAKQKVHICIRFCFISHISYAHGDLVHMYTYIIPVLHSSSSTVPRRKFFFIITWCTGGELREDLFEKLSDEKLRDGILYVHMYTKSPCVHDIFSYYVHK